MALLQGICLLLLMVSRSSSQVDLAGMPCQSEGDYAPGVCDVFYVCEETVNGLLWYKYRCPEGEIIDEDIDCVPGVCPDPGPPGWRFPCWKYVSENNQRLFQDPWECNKFWSCHDIPNGGYAPFKFPCADPAMVFWNHVQSCVYLPTCPGTDGINEEILAEVMG